ncbi:RHS repeat domain-containing protein [Rubidibacter lacunae]|nr:RHS repeat protein [Rubidibacter lacunae]
MLTSSRLNVTDPKANTTTFTYDDFYRLIRETNQLGLAREYKYDKVGNRTRATDRNGRVRTFEYDHRDRLTAEKWRTGRDGLRTFSYNYDAAGQLKTAGDRDSNYAYSYDSNGRLTKVDNSGTPDVPEVVLTYGYDSAGNRTSVSDNVGGVETWTFDDLNRVASIAQSGSGVIDKRVEFAYDAASQLDTIKRFNSSSGGSSIVTSDYDFDNRGRLTELTHGSIARYSFDYDAGDRLTRLSTPDGTATYKYDQTDQLTSANYSYQDDEGYSYHSNGNRTNTGYETGGDKRLLSDGTYTYEYD